MSGTRQPVIDALKVLASQMIVLHHLSTYGPVADAVEQALPGLIDWLFEYGRMAVQVFLVLGGYLAVQPLMQAMQGSFPALVRALGLRYLRLVPPFAAAMVLAVLATAWVRPWLSADLVATTPTAFQLLAHLLLLHELLDVSALSAGVWYVAIDFQLYALMALLLWLGQRGRFSRVAIVGVVLMTAASLLLWNGRAELEDWAIYFFGSYGMGAMARWVRSAPTEASRWRWRAGLTALGALALVLEFRPRIALALTVALLLTSVRGQLPALPDRIARVLAAMGRSSYALFLVHFPVLLVGNAWFERSDQSGPLAGISLVFAVWIISLVFAWAFERWIEAPLARRLRAPDPSLARA